MIVLLALIGCLAGAVAYMTGREVRAALEARPRDRHGLLRRRPAYDDHARIHARDYAPAGHRSLDKPPVCPHSSRPAAVVPYAHNAPVAWVCPGCDAVVPEPPPLGPAREPVAAARITPGVITADWITANAVLADEHARERREAAAETYEVRSHQSNYPVRTFTAPAWPHMPDLTGDWRRSNYATLLREAGHNRAYVADAMAEWDRRQTAAEPVRIDPRPSPGHVLPY